MRVIFLILLIVSVASCQKSNNDPLVEEKNDWRVTKIYTSTFDMLLVTLGNDSTYFTYDDQGRIKTMRYRVRAHGGGPSESNFDLLYSYEYDGNSEKIKRINRGDMVYDFTYDVSMKKLLSYSETGSSSKLAYTFKYNTGLNPSEYQFTRYYGSTPGEISDVKLTYSNDLLTQRNDSRYNGANIKEYKMQYNAKGNITRQTVVDNPGTVGKDTLRDISFNWITAPSTQMGKIQRIDMQPRQLIEEIGWAFYFSSYNLLTQFDLFNLLSNGEVLESYKWTKNISYMSSQINFKYELDSNHNISKIMGTVPNSSSRMEMLIEYEKIP